MFRTQLALFVGAALFPEPGHTQEWRAELPPPVTWQSLLFAPTVGRIVRVAPLGAASANSFLEEFDGVAWQPRHSAHEPPRRSCVATWASGWNRIVLVTTDGGPHQVWTWDGIDWTHVPTTNAPFPHWQTAIAFDVARQRLVLFGGFSIYGLVYDMWVFDGADWRAVGNVVNPAVRHDQVMGYDPVRQRLVMHGGMGPGFAFYRDTWEHDGTRWTQTGTEPQPLALRGMFWHPGRQRLIGVGFVGSLHEYDGTTWSLLTSCPAQGPLAAYDAARTLVVAHNGVYGPFSSPLLPSHELWEWNGTWTRRTPLPPPATTAAMTTDHAGARVLWYQDQATWVRDANGWRAASTTGTPTNVGSGRMTWDTARGRAVLFGGGNAGSLPPSPGFTWELDGQTWRARSTANAPSARDGTAITYDPIRRLVVLFGGGVRDSWTRHADTWLFDGTDWRQDPTAIAPQPRMRHTMAFHGGSGEVVLFGGDDISMTPLPDTWHFDANGWRQRITAHAPFGAWDAALVDDPWRGRLVLHGGTRGVGPAIDEVWEYDGHDWTPLMPTGEALPRQSHGMAFDPVRGTMVVCSGFAEQTPGGAAYPLATNSFDLIPASQPTWTRAGAGCAGSGGTPSLDVAPGALPRLGTTLPLQFEHLPAAPGLLWLTFGFGIDNWNGTPLPAPLTAFGLTDCSLWIAPAIGLGQAIAHGGGRAHHGLSLPASPALAGQRLAMQALVIDPATTARASVSNAGLAILN
ncbi:MAG: hypothetical protein IPK26_19750 [Planctomycetes bacterium]|nr:hypothetical protein [Planctomycetota bacterium]